MKKVQLALSDGNEGGANADSTRPVGVSAARHQMRRQAEELRLKVLDMAERHMDITVQVLKKWIQN